MLRRNFFLLFASLLWLLMAIGFSDNWLFDRGQPSNSEPKFMVHAFFAFCWFTALVMQAAFIRSMRYHWHFRLGLFAIVSYYLMTITIWYLYYEIAVAREDWSRLIKPLEILSIVLVTWGFLLRRQNSQRHKEYLVFGTFCLIGPALDRSVFHIFGPELMTWPMIILYWLLFGFFLWYKRGLPWYALVWVGAWTFSLLPLFKMLAN